MKFRKETIFCRDFLFLKEKKPSKNYNAKKWQAVRNTTLIFPKKQDTDFSPPERTWLKNICEMAVQHINFLACSSFKKIILYYRSRIFSKGYTGSRIFH